MLFKVEATNEQDQTLELPLEYTNNGYVVQEIEGLDPVKAVIVSSPFANQDGEEYQSSRRDARNIIIKLDLKKGAAGSVRDLRNRLYSFFMPESTVKLRFFDDEDVSVDISGTVESCVSPLFTDKPVATISILCHKPDFYVPEPVVISGNTVSDTTGFEILYEGSIETGLVLTMTPDRDLSEFTIYHRAPNNSVGELEFNEPLLTSDVLKISTVAGEKGATRTRNNSDSSVLYGVTPVSKWINLFPGTNFLRIHAEGAPVPFTITYTNKIGGL